MSQEAPVSQTAPSHFPNTTATWFPARQPRDYVPLPYEEPEDDGDEELRALKPASPSDVEAARSVTRRPRPALLHPKIPGARILAVLKTAAAVLASAVLSALFFSAWAWLAGGYILYTALALAPYTAVVPGDMFRAAMAGAPVVALAVVAALVLLDLCGVPVGVCVLDADNHDHDDHRGTAVVVGAACAPAASVFAMPVGFAMMPRLMVGGFGLRHALAMGATGFGVLVVACVLEVLRSVGSRR